LVRMPMIMALSRTCRSPDKRNSQLHNTWVNHLRIVPHMSYPALQYGYTILSIAMEFDLTTITFTATNDDNLDAAILV
jgi:hypothetical protein